MDIIVKIIGVLIAGLGIAFAAHPPLAKRMMEFWKTGNRVYYAGVIRLAIGVLILMAASGADLPLAAVALGLMFLASGSLIFVMGLDAMKKQIEYWEGQPDIPIRIMGVFAFTFGVLIFCVV